MPPYPPAPDSGSDPDRYDADRADRFRRTRRPVPEPDSAGAGGMDWFGTHQQPAPAPEPPPDPFADLRFAPRTDGLPFVDRYADRVEHGDSTRYSPSGLRPAPAPAEHPRPAYPPGAEPPRSGPAYPPAPMPRPPEPRVAAPPATEPPFAGPPAAPHRPRHGAPEYFAPDPGALDGTDDATGRLPRYPDPPTPEPRTPGPPAPIPGTATPAATTPGTSTPRTPMPGTPTPGTPTLSAPTPRTATPGTTAPGTTTPGTTTPGTAETPAADAGKVPAGSRLLSLATAAVAAVLFGVVGLSVGRGQLALLGAVVLVQVVLVLAWTIGGRRPGPWVVAVVGIGCAAAADGYGAYGAAVSIGPFGYVMAGGMIAAALGQLLRGQHRRSATESLGAALVAALGAVAVPALLVLDRHAHGTAGVMVTVAAAGAGVTAARLADTIVPKPRASLRVPRGFLGMAFGGIVAGTVAGYLAGSHYGLATERAALAGLVIGLASVLTDVGVSWGTAGRDLAAETPAGWPAKILLGPAAAAAVAALAGYVLGVLVLLPTK